MRGSFKKSFKNRSVFNKKFLSQAGTMSVYGGMTLIFVIWMLRKTKFYQTPFELSAVKSFDANKNFFYDPYVTFITLMLLNIAFTLLNNSKNLFKRSFFINFPFFFFTSLLFLFSLNILFVYQLY